MLTIEGVRKKFGKKVEQYTDEQLLPILKLINQHADSKAEYISKKIERCGIGFLDNSFSKE